MTVRLPARELLRKARATVNHDHSYGGRPEPDCHGCSPLSMNPDSPWEAVVDGHNALGSGGGLVEWHTRCASALLDGLSVRAVTKAGG